jgi:hypothetical protein
MYDAVVWLCRPAFECRPSRCRPINIPGLGQHVAGGPKARADVDPLAIDGSVTWSEVGGLETQVEAVKEMVLLPLLYPEVFERFRFTPPRGVLFYGPPGSSLVLLGGFDSRVPMCATVCGWGIRRHRENLGCACAC